MADEINWVKIRSEECSVNRVFSQLESGVRSDVVAAADALTRGVLPFDNYKVTFEVNKYGDRFTVVRTEASRIVETVEFVATRKGIQITGKGKQLEVIPNVNAKGECSLFVGDKELSQWQIRQMALADLFFIG